MGWRILCVAFFNVALLIPNASAQTLYGVTGTNLITIDPTNPNNVSIIGPHNLATDQIPANLTYDPITDRLLGKVRTGGVNADADRIFVFNRSTGQATLLSTIVDPTDVFLWDSFEFVGGARNQLVVSRGANSGPQMSVTAQFTAVNPDTGVTVPIVNNARDNDYSVWDSRRNRFYAWDPNNSTTPVIYEVNLLTGANTNYINVFQSATDGPGEGAYHPGLDAIFTVDFNGADPDFWRINFNASGNPATLTRVGAISGDHVFAIAFVPEPASLALLSLVIAAGALRRRNI
jgi:hypothetical protein